MQRICEKCGTIMTVQNLGQIKVLDRETVTVCEKCGNRRHEFEWFLGIELFDILCTLPEINSALVDLKKGKLPSQLDKALSTHNIGPKDPLITREGLLWRVTATNYSFLLDIENPVLGMHGRIVVYNGEAIKPAVWSTIRQYFYTKFKSVSRLRRPDMESYHWQIVTDYPRRKGKYVRPALLVLTSEAFGGKRNDALLTAAAMQTSEDWVLIHDDFEDNSSKRRGQPTLHIRFGSELSVNAGDSLQIIMWKMLIDNIDCVGSRKGKEIMEEFYEMLQRTTLGQTVEMSGIMSNNLNFTYDDVYYIIDGKTGYYTIAGPMRLGALVAGAHEKQLDMLMMIGTTLGRAFQIVDDLLDLTSDFRGLKEQGNDILEGKRTIMLTHLLQNASPGDKEKIGQILNKTRNKKTKAEVELVLSLMEKYGSIEFGKREAERYAREALAIIEKIDFSNRKAAETLRLAVDFMVNRDF
jgi:geranylgeranyl diphosphate synthase type II